MNDKLNKKKGGVAILSLMAFLGLVLMVSSCTAPHYGGHHYYMQENDGGG